MPREISTSFTMSDAAMRSALGEIQAALVDVCMTSAGLAIGTGSKKKVKVVNDTYAYINGSFVKLAASTEVTLSGTTANAKFAIYSLSLSAAGAVIATKGADAATLAALVFPAVPADETLIGFVIVNPTGTGNFVGGTTDLDDGTVIPGAAYVNIQGAGGWNPNVLAI